MPSRNEPHLEGADAYLSAIRDSGQALRQRYEGRPEALAERFHLRLPPKPVLTMIELGVISEEEAVERFGSYIPGLRELIIEVCTHVIESAAVVGPRGGGKSQGVSFIEFYMVFIELFDALNLGGSELQADQVYQYLLGYIDSDPYWQTLVKGQTMKERTYTTDDAWIRVLTASSKSVRSPHAGGRKKSGRLAGGILVIDEEAEAESDIVSAALPTINTAVPSVNVRSSTFHNAQGSFAELVDSHVEMGYKLYKWDVFDVCGGCDCGPDAEARCLSEEKCFREDHIETYPDPETGEEREKLLHKAYCGGRARYSRGWVPYGEILKLWRRMKRHHGTWEVEQMGSRPTSKGYVIEDRERFQLCIVEETPEELYVPGAPTWINIDWGTGRCGLEVWQYDPDTDRHILLECEQLEETGPTEQKGKISGLWARYVDTFVEVRGDLGGGGNYMNKTLTEEFGLPAEDVAFSNVKEAAARVFNILSEAKKLVIPKENSQLFIEQIKKWRRVNGHIMKGNDHLCDTALCYFSRLIEEMNLQHIRVGPKAFNTGLARPSEEDVRDALGMRPRQSELATVSGGEVRVPIVVSFGRRK